MATEAATTTEASAAGKVMVCGAYLVLERPNPALVFACTARFHSTVEARFPPPHDQGECSDTGVTEVEVSSPQMEAELRFTLRRASAGGGAGGGSTTTTTATATTTTISPADGQPANPFVELPLLYAL